MMNARCCLAILCSCLFPSLAEEFDAAAELKQCPLDAQILERMGCDVAVDSYEADMLLLHAVIQGRFELAKALLKIGCRVSNEHADVCLDAACGASAWEYLPDGVMPDSARAPHAVKSRPGQAEMVRCLMQTTCTPYDGHALNIAIRSGDAATVHWLLYYGVQPEECDLTLAEHCGNQKIINLLRSADYYTHEMDFREMLEDMPEPVTASRIMPLLTHHHKARVALMYFLRQGRFDEACQLLPYVKGVNFRMFRPLEDGMTPLLHACGEGVYGGDFGHEYAPHADFARPGQAEMIRRLLAAGADPNFPREFNSELPIIKAARTGDIGSVRLLLEAGADVHARDREGKCALDYAAADGQIFMVRYLLTLPGMPAAENVQVNLAGAVEYNRADCLQELISCGALTAMGDAERLELLRLAACSHAAECFALLHGIGLDIYALHEGLNPLGYLLELYCREEEKPLPLLRYMIARGMHQHIPSARAALQSAVSMGLAKATNLLLAAGVPVDDPTFVASLLKAAEELREEKERSAVQAVLKRYGIQVNRMIN